MGVRGRMKTLLKRAEKPNGTSEDKESEFYSGAWKDLNVGACNGRSETGGFKAFVQVEI